MQRTSVSTFYFADSFFFTNMDSAVGSDFFIGDLDDSQRNQALFSYYYDENASSDEDEQGLVFCARSSESSLTSLESVKEEVLDEVEAEAFSARQVPKFEVPKDESSGGISSRPRSPTPFSNNVKPNFTFLSDDIDSYKCSSDFNGLSDNDAAADDEAEDDDETVKDDSEYLRYMSSSPMSVYEVFSGMSSPTGVTVRNKVLRSESGRWSTLNQYKYESHSTIGYGAFSEVKLVINQENNTRYAMKILSKAKLQRSRSLMRRSSQGLDAAFREIAVLRKIDHPNIVKLIEVLDDPEEDGLYLIFEYLENGRVLEIPTQYPLNELDSSAFFRDIVSGLEYLHKQKIIHRDLKPENMLVCNNGRIKIADFGLSGEFDSEDDDMPNPFGTPAFIAPECVSEEKGMTSGRKMDIWSLGVSLYSFVVGDVPFKGEFLEQLFENIKTQDLMFPEDLELSSDLKDLLNRLLEKDPAKRITIEEIKQHKWVTKNNTINLPEVTSSSEIKISEEDVKTSITEVHHLHDKVFLRKKHEKKSHALSKSPHKHRTSNWRRQRDKQRRAMLSETECFFKDFPKAKQNQNYPQRKRTHSSCSCTSSDGLAYYLSTGGKGKTKCSCRKLPKKDLEHKHDSPDCYSSDDELNESDHNREIRERRRANHDLSPFNIDARIFLEGFLRASRRKADDSSHDTRSVISLSPADLCRGRDLNARPEAANSLMSVPAEA